MTKPSNTNPPTNAFHSVVLHFCDVATLSKLEIHSFSHSTTIKMSFDENLDDKIKSFEALEAFRELNLQELSRFLVEFSYNLIVFRRATSKFDIKNLSFVQ